MWRGILLQGDGCHSIICTFTHTLAFTSISLEAIEKFDSGFKQHQSAGCWQLEGVEKQTNTDRDKLNHYT